AEDRERRRDEHEERGGQQALRAASPEGCEADPTRAVELAQQVARDEEAGDDEEHVDPDVAAREAGGREVVREHGRDGERAQRLDLREQLAARGRPRLRAAVPGALEVRGRGRHKGAMWWFVPFLPNP